MSKNDHLEAIECLVSIDDFIRWATSQFYASSVFFGHGTVDAHQEAYALVMGALHLPFELYEQVKHTRLVHSEKEHLVAMIDARINQRIPVPYLLNKSWFCGIEFYVDERVLIPRSPIGELIEQRFEAWIEPEKVSRVLDLCTGSACIAIACAYAFPDAEVDAVDLSSDALDVAQYNIENLGCLEQVFPILSDCFEAIPKGTQYDLIVSNPPYVDQEDFDDMPEEFAHEPEMALVSGNDGLDLTRKILAEAPDYLTEDGVLILEVGNSMLQLIASYPEVHFEWIKFDRGGDGVFAISKKDLLAHRHEFIKTAKA